MADSTKIGGDRDEFPVTRHSAILGCASTELEERTKSFQLVSQAYWKPIYKYIRIRWAKSNEDAKDLTQGFFVKAIEKNYFKSFDPSKARFRTFVRVCVDRYVANHEKAMHRIKRGGAVVFRSFDFDDAENEMSKQALESVESPEDCFDREWVRDLFSSTVERLRQKCASEGKTIHYEVFKRYDLDPDESHRQLSYADIAEDLNLPVSQVTNYLNYARREFRTLLADRLRALTANDEEFESEIKFILGVDIL